MGRDDRESMSGSMKRSAGNAFGNAMGCFAAGIVIIIILMVLSQSG